MNRPNNMPAVYAEIERQLDRADGWENPTTNIGVAGLDKSEATRFRANKKLTYRQLDALYVDDGMAAKLVDDIVDDAFRMGWRIVPGSNDDGFDSTALNRRVRIWEKRTGFHAQLKAHIKKSRAYGGSLLLAGLEDGGDPREELSTDRLRAVKWFRAIDRYQASGTGKIDGRPGSPNFGKPIEYSVYSYVSTGLTEEALEKTPEQRYADGESIDGVRVHSSRVWRTDGLETSDRSLVANDGWGDSILQRAYEPLRHWSITMRGAGVLVQDSAQGVYKIRGLDELLTSGNESLIRKRFSLMDRVRSIVNAILVDADDEDFERKPISMSGLPETIDRAAMWLSAVSGKPLTKLIGISPGGFGTGEAEGDNWDDIVKAFQTEVILPALEWAYGMAIEAGEVGQVGDDWSIEFNALQMESPSEDAEMRNKNAQTDALYIANGVLSPRDVKSSRFGGPEYGLDISVDMEASDDIDRDVEDEEAARLNAEAAREPDTGLDTGDGSDVFDVQKQGLNGGQVASLRTLVIDYTRGDIGREAAIGVALFAFPTMERSQAEAIFTDSPTRIPEDDRTESKPASFEQRGEGESQIEIEDRQ